MATVKPKTQRRKAPPDPQVSIIGTRVSAALAAAGLSVKAAAKLMADRGLARISQSALNTVARGRTATTRASVRTGLARLVIESLDPNRRLDLHTMGAYLAGFGPDLSTPTLISLRLATRRWDAEWAPPRSKEEAGRTKSRALATVLDLDRWRALLGDPRAVESDEARVEFARLLSRALEIATELPIPDDAPPGKRIRKLAGLHALAETLQSPPPESP